MIRQNRVLGFLALLGIAAGSSSLHAAPYASGVSISGTSVSFILNQPTATLTYSINGGAPVALDGSTKGTKSFTLGAPTDHFSIVATDSEASGFLIPTGGTTPPNTAGCAAAASCTGLSIDSPASGTVLISDDSSVFSRYANPRGVDVVRNPNAAYFGTVYVTNGNGASVTGGNVVGPGSTPANVDRTVGKGIYAVHADESDAFGNGDTAVNPTNIDTFPAFATSGNTFGTSVANSPYRLSVGSNGNLYVSDYSDANGQIFEVNPNLTGGATTSTNLLHGFGGPAGGALTTYQDGTALSPWPGCANCTPDIQNHGSISSAYVTGSLATNDLTLWTVDEDLTSGHVAGTTGSDTGDRNSLWRYNIGGTGGLGVDGYNNMPTQFIAGAGGTQDHALIGDFPPGGIIVDMDRGPDGRFYLSENRSAGTVPGLIVTDSNGAFAWSSLQESRTLLNDPSAPDILTGVGGIAVSPDGKYLATIQIDNDIAILPLVNGIPDLANRLVMDGGTNTGNGRDIAWDAADNLYYVSSGQGMYRAFSPGGNSTTTLSWDGSQYAFSLSLTTSLTGDYNGDGKVDAADYVIWRKTNINGAQGYTDWKTNFGSGTPGAGSALGGAAVPEPGSLVLAMFGMMLAAAYPRRKA